MRVIATDALYRPGANAELGRDLVHSAVTLSAAPGGLRSRPCSRSCAELLPLSPGRASTLLSCLELNGHHRPISEPDALPMPPLGRYH
jgi:hypothetical protein